jgi:hypothetical protein
METKFKIGQEVYMVKEYQIYPLKINAILIRIDDKGKFIKYEALYPNNKAHEVGEGLLVTTWEEAINCASRNWELIDKSVRNNFENYKPVTWEEARKIVEERLKQKIENDASKITDVVS